MAWYVYILRCGDGALYTGCTNDVERRLRVHQSGKGAKYTRSRLPVVLEYREELPDKSAALQREAAIKKLSRQQKLELIAKKERGHVVKMRRKDREMPEAFAWGVVEKSEYAVLSMVTEESEPYGIPITIVRCGNAIYFHGAKEGRKADCLRRNPKVCLTCVGDTEVHQEAFTTLYESAIVFGIASEVVEDEEKIEALRKLCLRHTPDAMAHFGKEIADSLHHTAIWKITVEEISGKSNR